MRRRIFYVLAAISLFAAGCNEPDDGNHTDPITIYEKIDGQWSLMSLKMVDEVAKASNIQPNEQNLSALFNYEDFKIKFNVDANNNPTTYEVIGDVPPLFEPSGYWVLSSAFQQADAGAIKILLCKDAARTQVTDVLRITSVPGSNNEMEIQLNRQSGGVPFVSYIFKLGSN
ncbi:DUF5004 domain-containing protein [Flavobacterium sp.]|uniref:DUF5004 domain-containing protein n=1 Tax=Flavobacterium sp. TaxID=239 RepID=UPI0039E45D4B